jgi:uncharacterized membrane protein (UPF0127 family)
LITIPRLAAILFAVGWAVFAGLVAHAPARAAGQATIEIITKSGVRPFAVELATTNEERMRGLMFRKELPEGQGMLFDFGQDQPVSFWMHNTYISLDMIFIRADGRILHIAENTEPLSDRLVPSGGPIRGVLEVIAGTASKLGIAPGDRVTGAFFEKSR